MYADKGKAEQLKKRYCLLNPADEDVFDMLTDTKDGRCPAYDLLTISFLLFLYRIASFSGTRIAEDTIISRIVLTNIIPLSFFANLYAS
mgnify:CR=1 FL=1